jgi:CheY-like chemotaxis protein
MQKLPKPPLILVVEDSTTQAKNIALNLVKCGMRISIASDGLEALALVEMDRPDAVVLDINLPKMDGYQVCRRIKRDEKMLHIPVIILTSSTDPTALETCAEVGANDFIFKDQFAMTMLIDAIRKQLNIT